MPSVIKLKSGQCETVFDLAGLLYLVEQHMGDEARRLLEDFTAPEDDAAEYIDGRSPGTVRNHCPADSEA